MWINLWGIVGMAWDGAVLFNMSLPTYSDDTAVGTNRIHGKKCMISRQNF